jgi:uncharacterized protein YjdB
MYFTVLGGIALKRTFKSVLAVMLVFTLAFGGAPLGALAGLDFKLPEWLKSPFSLDASATRTWRVGDIGTFGSYPQTRVTDSATLSALNAKTLNWVSYGYYSGTGNTGSMTQSDYMKYADVTHGGSKYRAVKFTSYRPYYTTYSSSASNTYQDENGYYTNTVYWFKYEPLRWRVLDPSSGLVMCEDIIDSQAYSNMVYGSDPYYNNSSKTVYANDYVTSSMRTWLNGFFLQTAFTSTEQSDVKTTALDNSAWSGYPEYNSASTNDKLFLLSYSESSNTAYGFSSSYFDDDPARRAQGSDYAKCQGLYVYGSPGEYLGNSRWFLRSPGNSSYLACNVIFDGSVHNYFNVNSTCLGIRPAFKILNLSSLTFISSEAVPVTGVSLGAGSLSLKVAGTSQLTATVTPPNATNKLITWTSSNTAVAIVSASGLVTAKALGTATITVMTADGGFTDTCIVTVTNNAITGIKLDAQALSLQYKSMSKLTVTFTPSNVTNKNVTWTSDNEKAATVDQEGNVTAKGRGTATITATADGTNISDTCAVTVKYAWWQWLIKILLFGWIWY